jgi:hypothetical protein
MKRQRTLPIPLDLIHEGSGNNTLAWWTSADTLLSSAEVLYPTSLPTTTSVGTLMDVRSSVYGMLIGFAIECFLKARWIAAGNPIVKNGRMVDIPGAGDHQLVQLADATEYRLTKQQRDVLGRLTALVLFVGRYPIPRTAEGLKPQRTTDGETLTPRVFRRADFTAVEAIASRLKAGPWPWGAEAAWDPTAVASTTELLQPQIVRPVRDLNNPKYRPK